MPSWADVLNRIESYEDPYDHYRQRVLSQLNEYTERDVLLYSSGWTHSPSGSAQETIIDADMQGIMEAFSEIDGEELDIVLHSPGGDPGATESIVDYIRSKYDDIRIFVPHAAMSAATMMCCAADTLVMGRHSFLGPIDPQMTLDTPTGHRPVPAGAILSQFEQAQEDIEDDQENLAYWTPIIRQYGPGLLQECKQAMDLSEELAREWASEYLLKGNQEPLERAESLSSDLTDYDEFKIHNRHLHRDRARTLGFEVEDLEDDDTLQDLVLTTYHIATLTHDHKSIAKIIETHEGNRFMSGTHNQGADAGTTQSFNQPPNGPPQPENEDLS